MSVPSDQDAAIVDAVAGILPDVLDGVGAVIGGSASSDVAEVIRGLPGQFLASLVLDALAARRVRLEAASGSVEIGAGVDVELVGT